jgi:periplasmic copper chaperone A
MANVTVSPGRSGPIEVVVQLEDPQENALPAEGLSVTLTGPNGRSAPITTSAERISSDTWRARMFVPAPGKWALAVHIAMTAKEKIEIAAPILIE